MKPTSKDYPPTASPAQYPAPARARSVGTIPPAPLPPGPAAAAQRPRMPTIPPNAAMTDGAQASSGQTGTAPAARQRMPTVPPNAMMDGGQGAAPMVAPTAANPSAMTSQPPPALPAGPIDASWQRIWLRTQGRDWVSLAVIGTSQRSPDATMRVAGMLARVSEELGHPLVVLDARDVELRTMASIQARMRALSARGTRAITVLQLPSLNPVTVPIAQAADASMLCVFVGESRLTNTEQTIEQIGRDRFLGTVILRHP